MATASSVTSSSNGKKRKSKRRKTSHLKAVPTSLAMREELRQRAIDVASQLDKTNPMTKDEMETVTRRILSEAGQPDSYVGWMMVMLASAFWQDQVAAVPPSRRLFLLPHCLKHAQGCPADYDQFGLDCKECGACSIADFRTQAEDMGYRVLVAEGSPIVLKIIVSGYVDAIVGVACLNVLEKAIDKILLAGIPCMAVPLLSSDCRNTAVDEQWVNDMIHVKPSENAAKTRTYVHIMRTAANMFEPDQLERLSPRLRGDARLIDFEETEGVPAQMDPIAGTEILAYDFLAQGGKHSRPFITLAVHDALTGGKGTLADGHQAMESVGDEVKRIAASIETFHKASLVHDDIEDGDLFRYGQQTMHRRFGVPTAINVGDYLIGMGYRLISRDAATTGPETAADILDILAQAHLKLSEGQGAELLWRDAKDKRLKPLDALRIYALKTSPAFEAALCSGARIAGPLDDYAEPFKLFARNMGVAFQILNDLKDWQGDEDNKMGAAGDTLGGRPTVLLALALDELDEAGQEELIGLVSNSDLSEEQRVQQVRKIYLETRVFEKAHLLVDKHQARAEAIADEIEPKELRRLLYYLIDSVLDRDGAFPVEQETVTIELPSS